MIYSKCVLWTSCCTCKDLLSFRKKSYLLWNQSFVSKSFKKRRKSLHRSCRLQCEGFTWLNTVSSLWSPSKSVALAWKTKRSLTRAHTIALQFIFIQNQFRNIIMGVRKGGLFIMLNNDVSNLRGLNSAFRLGHGQFHVVLWHLPTHIRYVMEILSNKVKCAQKSTHTVYQ